ncbi:GtrA family protein [Paenibacillus sp. LMG 31458]|uniref:GtrA family protein n=1 Tax=Paenibacillus phytorum TaxID=2654977 RepID=A0ABX1XXT1_9BACL|nr:GtrA family protein [Paenibacillus phytorum]NOU73089.1 GtrA family protein [Paenibacillus phytorum]
MNRLVMQWMKYGLVGAVNTSIDFAVFTLLTLWGWPHLLAQGISFTSGVLNSYFMNRSWTFQASGDNKHQFLKFISLSAVLMLMTSGLLISFAEHLGWPLWISKLAATGSGVVFNYIGSRKWVFTPSITMEKGVV